MDSAVGKKYIFRIVVFLAVFVSFFGVISLFASKQSYSKSDEDKWDGVSVADSFSGGNGSSNNPFLISSSAELIYFKQVIENDNTVYGDKSFKLTTNINLADNNISPIGIEGNYFKGVFDGDGFSIYNTKIKESSSNYYGLFSKISDGSVRNLNLENIVISPSSDSSNLYVGILAGEVSSTNYSSISNISISNSSVDLSNTNSNKNSRIGGFVGYASENVDVNNIFLGYHLVSSYTDYIGKVIGVVEGSVNNVVLNMDFSNSRLEKVNNYYNLDQDVFNFDGKTYRFGKKAYSIEQLLAELNYNSSDYYFEFEDDRFVVYKYVEGIPNNRSAMSFSFSAASATPVHSTGVSGDTVYINDLESDYNSFVGLDYTDYTSNGQLPTGNRLGLYNDSNLVQVYVEYNGQSLVNSNLIGYVSLQEQQSKFIYYKYYKVENGYITIELIDNPYADRPDNKAFNGWVTTYPGAVVSIDVANYVRYAKIPVSDVNSPVSITFNASWVNATTVETPSALIYGESYWNNNIYANLDNAGLKRIVWEYTQYESISGLYVKGTTTYLERYPSGAVNSSGSSLSGSCSLWNITAKCDYYAPASGSYDASVTYYKLNGTMQVYKVQSWIASNGALNYGESSAGLYVPVNISYGSSLNGYYNSAGTMLSGTCTNTSGCANYQLLQYYGNNGAANVVQAGQTYYYQVTRDTNIVVMTRDMQDKILNTKPMTLTGINNGRDYNTVLSVSFQGLIIGSYSYIKPEADLRVEHLLIESNTLLENVGNDDPPSADNTGLFKESDIIFGNFKNFKIGRGIRFPSRNNIVNALGIMGGSNTSTGSASSFTKYRLIVESGFYNFISITNGAASGESSVDNLYVNATGIYGSDYDRAKGDNNKLKIYFSAVANWGSQINKLSSPNTPAITTIVKSGSFGTGYNEYMDTTNTGGAHTFGIYAGGRGVKTALNYAPRSITVEGGWIHALNGGPLAPNTKTENDTYINVKGGTIDFIFGGAGTSATYGNRILNITGGTINYSVFGGSNSYSGADGDGTLNGSTFIYIGGNAVIGSDSLVNAGQTMYGVEAGSVFGIGNGKNGVSTMGSANGSGIVIDRNAVIKRNVYGGGNYGAVGVGTSYSSANIKMYGGTVNGSVYGGGNNNGAGDVNSSSDVNIEIYGGIVNGSIYGGCRTKGTVYGNTNIKLYNGAVNQDVYGGGEGGYSSSSNPGTFVTGNVLVSVGDSSTSNLSIGNVYGGSAYGTVNGSATGTDVSTATTNVVINNGVVTGSVFGGGKGSSSFTPYVKGPVTVNINGGSIGNVYGGNDQKGNPNTTDVVYISGGVVGNAFGGGNNTAQETTNIYLKGGRVTNLFGGSNLSGSVSTSNIFLSSGTVTNVYGGNNAGGSVTTTYISATGGTYIGAIYGGGKMAPTDYTNISISTSVNDVYGGGEEASIIESNIDIVSGGAASVYGGSNKSGDVSESDITVSNGTVTNIYGGNNSGGTTTTCKVSVTGGTITNLFGGGNNATSGTSSVLVSGSRITNLYGGGNYSGLTTSSIDISGGSITNVFGGSNESGDIEVANVVVGTQIDGNISIGNIYGGNNKGGVTTVSNVDVNYGDIGNIYGGGNQAVVGSANVYVSNASVDNLFGGGNQAAVNNNTFVDIDSSEINANVFGGGNDGSVLGSTEVYITDTTILGSAYAGGNGRSATVLVDTTITLDGDNVIGTAMSKPPYAGSVFASGNAAATGNSTDNGSIATVNIVGGHIYGNVYGGANTSVVYGTTNTNIGTSTVSKSGLVESDIIINGTVFGGGEANAAGSENYDYNSISVTVAINVNIDGEGYIDNGHEFILNGSIFGSGNASSSQGTSEIYIHNLGTRSNPSQNISIQRADSVIIDNSVIELKGTTDRTNEYSSILYSFNRIDDLNIKNNTVLLLQENANLLKQFRSTVDIGGDETVAVADIDSTTGEVIKNVDNRIYMEANKNLNITTNEAATNYGRVSGMTFFGMYNSYKNGTYRYGVYGDDVNHGDSATAADAIAGGSYVLGLHSLNHDITVDGFYSNYLSEDYSTVSTAYIEPIPPDTNYYMWTIGIPTISYSFTLNASKYSSLGTYELSMRDFSQGDTTFDVIGFNIEGLGEEVSLIDPALVPKIADSEEEANKILGLAMKSETREWTSYGTTKLLSAADGSYEGDTTYTTDSQAIAPSLMFYLYHAKNISINENIGTVVISLQASNKINEIETETQLIIITIDIVASIYEDEDTYDASIAYDRKYEMPSATTINITNRSQFTAYYSLFAYADNFQEFYGNNNSNYRALTTNYALPVGTQITMIDSSVDGVTPKYYYYTVDDTIYNNSVSQLESDGEISYLLSDFIKMGSTSNNNTYSDRDANLEYYSEEYGRIMEEFIFIFDFKETSSTGTHLDNYILFELRNSDDRAIINVLGIRQNLMKFNLYDSSNVVLNQNVNKNDDYLYYGVKSNINFSNTITYNQTESREAIINTNYESSSMGINATIYDSSDNQISSSLLSGTYMEIDGVKYYVDSDGVFRIKLAGKVSNLRKVIYLETDELLPPGVYTIRFVLFASSDGRHNSHTLESTTTELEYTVIGNNNSIVVNCKDEEKVILANTGLNLLDRNYNIYSITYESVLSNPNVRLSLFKRNVDTYNTTSYEEIDISEVFDKELLYAGSSGYIPSSSYERLLGIYPSIVNNLDFAFKNNLTSGTYRLVFKLYDGNQLIEEEYEYIIIKKSLV